MAATQAVKVTNDVTVDKIKNPVTAKVKDFDGGKINSRSVPSYGAFQAPGSPGAVDVWEFKGAFIGLMDNLDATPIPSEFTIPAAGGKSHLDNLVIMESANFPASTVMDCELEISTDAVEAAPGVPLPLLEGVFTEPTVLESPLRLTDDFHLKLTGAGNNTGDTNCSIGIVGFVPSSALAP